MQINMRATRPCFFATATAAAALLVLRCAATGPTPSRWDSSGFGVRSDCMTESFGIPDRHATITGTSAVWVATTATPFIATNVSYNYIATIDLQDCALSSLGGHTILPDFQTVVVSKLTSHPNRRTTTTTTTTTLNRSNGRKTTTSTPISATKNDIPAAATSRSILFHDSFDGGAHEDTGNESGWRRFRHEPLPLPDEFMARFLITLMYLAEVITVDVISVFLFGRWRPRYYQRAKKNRLDRARRRRYRRFVMYVADVGLIIVDACVRLHNTLCPTQNGVSTTTCQMVSNLQLTEYPATLSAFADVPTSEVVTVVASATCSALVSITSFSAPTSAFPDLPPLTPNGTLAEATTTELWQAVPTLVPRLLGAPDISEDASCYPSASLPDTGLSVALRSAVSRRSPLTFEAAPPTTELSLSPTIGVPAAGREEMVFSAQKLLQSSCPSSTVVANGYAVIGISSTNDLTRSQHNTKMSIIEDSSTERECLAVLGVNLLLEGLASPSSPTSPSTRKHRPTTVVSGPNPGYVEGMVNSLMIHIPAAERSVTTRVEEFGGQADDADDTPPIPFFVSEHYTPESICYVSAHGVAYTTITMSYVHRVNLRTRRGTQYDNALTTQAGDVSDILFTTVNARMRCKWSRECIQIVSSEYYRSSVEAVFVTRFIPDATDVVVLSDLVTRHL